MAKNLQMIWDCYSGDRKIEMYAYKGLGEVFKKKNPDRALEYFDQALIISQEIKDQKQQANIYNNLGDVFCCQKYGFDLAITNYEKALEISKDKDIDYKRFQVYALIGLGDISQKKKEYTEAVTFYRQVVDIYQNHKTPKIVQKCVHALQALVNISKEQNKLESAEDNLKKAIKICKLYMSDISALESDFAIIHIQLGGLQLRKENDDRVSKTPNYLDQAWESLKEAAKYARRLETHDSLIYELFEVGKRFFWKHSKYLQKLDIDPAHIRVSGSFLEMSNRDKALEAFRLTIDTIKIDKQYCQLNIDLSTIIRVSCYCLDISIVQAKSLNFLTQINIKEGNYSEALKTSLKEWVVCQSLNEQEKTKQLKTYTEPRLQEAIDNLKTPEKISGVFQDLLASIDQDKEDYEQTVDELYALGKILKENGKWYEVKTFPQAKKILRECYRYRSQEESPDTEKLARICETLAQGYREIENKKELASQYDDQASKIRKTLQSK